MREYQPLLTQLFKDATFSPAPNLHTCISLVKVYRFGQCLGERFSPLSTFFSLVNSRAFRNAPHSRFWRRDLKLYLLHFLKLLHLALSQIYSRVFHLWKSVASDNIWVSPFYIFFSLACFRAFNNAANSRFYGGDPKPCLQGSLKMLVFALLQIHTNVFHLWKSIDLDTA